MRADHVVWGFCHAVSSKEGNAHLSHGGSAVGHCPHSRDTPLMVNHFSYKWDAEEALGKRSIGVNLPRPFYSKLFIFYVQ